MPLSRSRVATTAVAAAVAVVAVLAGCSAGSPATRRTVIASPADAAQAPAAVTSAGLRTVSAHAIGKAEGAPDVLTITIGVQTQATRAHDALADNNTRAAAVIAKLKADGVADKDVQTSQLWVNPAYSGGNTPVITGYQVTDNVTAKLRKLDVAGQVIDDAAGAGGDAARINGISFAIDNDSALLAQARADAVRQASDRVKAMADAAGVKLGQIHSVSDISVSSPSFPQFRAAGVAKSAMSDQAVPIQAGSEQLTVDVNVVWEIA